MLMAITLPGGKEKIYTGSPQGLREARRAEKTALKDPPGTTGSKNRELARNRKRQPAITQHKGSVTTKRARRAHRLSRNVSASAAAKMGFAAGGKMGGIDS